ncbi:MAG: hypothetical protein QG639_638, partial [Patescibacteria group bacterium]|nr:hypothetical protein [Patescibacteria group bacterium]
MSLIEQKSELQSPQRPVDLKVLANSEHTAPIVISHLETDGCILITAKKSEDFVTFMSRFADSVDEQGYEVRIEDSEVLSSAAANINRPEGNIQPVILVDDASKFLNEEGINTFVKNATILSNKVCPVLYRDEADFTNK